MLSLLIKILAVLAPLLGSAYALYRRYFSSNTKARRKILKQGEKAIDKKDPSAITAAFDKLNRLPVILLLCLVLFSGCQKDVILHPIGSQDIIPLHKDEQISYVDKDGVKRVGAPKDGFFISSLYMKEVMKAKVQ